MIEIEHKFNATGPQFLRLLNVATFVRSVVHHDIWYDDEKFSLMRRGLFLRERNGNIELKVRRNEGYQGFVHNEIHGLDAVCAYLKVDNLSMFKPVVNFVTYRQQFLLEDFSLDVDHVTALGTDFVYDVAEIEKVVNDQNDINSADEAILNLAKSYQLIRANGKLVEYFSRCHQDVYTQIFNLQPA